MRAPEFWGQPPGLWARLLSPAGAVVAAAARRRRASAAPYRPRAAVICIGNLVVGGAGKTPTAIAVADRLAARGIAVRILSRGYGGRLKGPHRVDPATDTAADVGDEPLLMARRHAVWIGRDRAAAARSAEIDGAEALILDDGHQNPSLVKDLSVVVIDAGYGHGNGRVMPAGPLREPLEVGLARADAAIVIGAPPPGGDWPALRPGLPAFRARLTPQAVDPPLAGRRVLAFAGIGRPQKFFDTVRSLGADVVETAAFADHHPYSAAIIARLEARAARLGATLVTTEKDAMRLSPRTSARVVVVPVALGFAASEAVDALLADAIAAAPIGPALAARLGASARL